ncbi:MAG: hypothetical protein WD295_00495, partial [Bacteroidota bacterium]
NTFDRYIANIGGNGYDFEGYRIYRSSDPAFLDALQITNARGILTFRLPIAQYDLANGIVGYDSVGFDGVHFYLGSDTGLRHSFVDSSVQNGFSYYYAITSYDFGYVPGKIIPAECDIRISLNPDGSVKSTGRNVVKVKPEAPAAGYVPPSLGKIDLVAGSTAGEFFYEIVDPDFVRDGHVYYITFQDTILPATITSPPRLTTRNFTLTDSTGNAVLIDRDSTFGDDAEYPITDGFRLRPRNSPVEYLGSQSGWNTTQVPQFTFEPLALGNVRGTQAPYDYTLIFGAVGIDTAKAGRIGTTNFPARPVNFRVFNNSRNEFIDFLFAEIDTTGGLGKFTTRAGGFRDRIIFSEKIGNDSLVTWWFYMNASPDTSLGMRAPQAGDTAVVRLRKPFLSGDQFRFVAKRAYIDTDQAKVDLGKIKVVPNPYLANALWESKNPYTSGRGPRSIHFIHLPNLCTIRIFTVSGELVKEIRHDSPMQDGTAEWNLLTKDNLGASYGIYIYHVDAPGIGQT